MLTDSLIKIRRELNHLYTEVLTEVDAGLFCREHALHLQGVSTALGHQAEICTGMFGLRIPGKITNAMTTTDADHAWCRIDGIAPVDVSMTLRGVPFARADVRLVYGNDSAFLAGFEIQYHGRCTGPELEARLAASSTDVLVYSEQAVEARGPLELHADPFSFLLPPLLPGAPTIDRLYGEHVFYAVTLHCLRVARGEAKSITYREPPSAFRTIAGWYPDARRLMEVEWAQRSKVS